MRSKTQAGGQTDSVLPPDLPKAFFTSPHDNGNVVLSGGAKPKPAAKAKPAKAKPAKAKPAKAKPAKGGSLAQELKSLAVPFAILLAKQGLDGMFDSKKKPKAAIEASSSKRKTAVGGACSACTAPSAPKAGGSSKSRYAQLANEIDEFLSKY